jgi:hypothetical protein
VSLGFLGAALAVAASDPVAFQKVGALSGAAIPPFDSATVVDVAPTLRAMPDRGSEGSSTIVYDVLPLRKRQRTLGEGWGNCSSLVFGMAAELDAEGKEYRIVHLMPLEHFLDGTGHTLLRARFALPEGPRLGLVDVAAAAIPRSAGRPLEPEDLGRGEIPGFRLDPVRPESEDWTPFYAEDFQSDLVLGWITSADLARYFRFLETVYVDAGLPPRVEKIVYDGLALVLGFYPTIHADRLAEARQRHRLRFAMHETSLWTLRIAPFLLVASAGLWLYDRRRSA